jgi:predicted dehydrogenase
MLRAAICGPGHWGTRLIAAVHGKSATFAFTAAVTRNPAGRADLKERFGLALTSDYAAVLRDPSIDAVVLATPHSQHGNEIEVAARAGKHVLAEKPFTLTRADAERAIAACREAGITLHVGFNRRYAPAYVDMVKRISAGEIGRVRHVEGHFSGPASYQTEPGNWRSNQLESPGGAMTARGVHVLDSMLHIAGPVESVFALSEKLQHEIDVDDTTACALRFASGATGMLGLYMRQVLSTAFTCSARTGRWKCAARRSFCAQTSRAMSSGSPSRRSTRSARNWNTSPMPSRAELNS